MTTINIADEWLDAVRASLGARAALVDRLEPAIPAGYDELNDPPVAALDFVNIDDLVDAPVDVTTDLLQRVDGSWRFRIYRRGESIPLADMLPLLDHLGLRALDERAFGFGFDSATVWLHDVGVAVPAEVELTDADQTEVQRCFLAEFNGTIEVDGLNRLVLLAGLTARQIEILRGLLPLLAPDRLPVQPAVHRSHAGSSRIDQPTAHRLVRRPLRPRLAGRLDRRDRRACRDHRGARCGTEPRRRSHAAFAAGADRGDRAHQRLSPERRRRSSPGGVVQVRHVEGARPAAAATDVRDLGVLTAGRGNPSAQWPDRPWWHSLERSTRGLPHRGPRARQGPDRQERCDRADRRQGRVRRRRSHRPRPTSFVPRAWPATASSSAVCSTSPTTSSAAPSFRRPTPFATTTTIRTSSSRPTRARRRSATSPTRSPPSTGSGWAMHLPRVAATATTTRAMGITARGAWESVRRHARALGKDADRDELTIVGIGDMSGDVFGNGMLRSPHVKLVAAFDHRHIFIDPDPDPAVSFAERKRLFDLPRSSWANYDTSLISLGGGVYPRTLKTITLSPEARKRLGTEQQTFTPNELLSTILRAPVDVLWNGGIGTYVKASTESHAEVGDRANDGLRVNGSELRCRMVGEGGNLGLTQRGRVEFALDGGLGQHRRNRQLRRRRLQRPRGQHQDPSRRRDGRGCDDDRTAQRGVGRDDRRGRRPGARRQPRPDAHARHRPPPGAADGQRACQVPARARGRGMAQPHARVPADRQADRRTASRRDRSDDAGVRRRAGVHQERQHDRDGAHRVSRRPVPRARSGSLLPDGPAAAVPARDPRGIGCAARSSPRRSPTRWSTCRASRSTIA